MSTVQRRRLKVTKKQTKRQSLSKRRHTKTHPRPNQLSNEWVAIRRSPIEGWGMFAKTHIPARTRICDFYGKDMTIHDFTQKYGPYKHNSLHTYSMRRIGKFIVAKEEPYRSRNMVNFVNEIPGQSNSELRLRGLYSKRDLSPGEEILIDYPATYNRFWLA